MKSIAIFLLLFTFSVPQISLAFDVPNTSNFEQPESDQCDWPITEFSTPEDHEDWVFIDCVHTPVDCHWLALRCGYQDYLSIHRGRPCSRRVYQRYACYGS